LRGKEAIVTLVLELCWNWDERGWIEANTHQTAPKEAVWMKNHGESTPQIRLNTYNTIIAAFTSITTR
jgi:hypothetical protein